MKLRVKRNIDLLVGQPLIWFFIPFARLLGLILKRDHKLEVKGKILVLKMAGGGSLYIAYPALKALKNESDHPIDLLCTQAVAPFAKTLGIFDNIIVLDGSGIFGFIKTYIGFWMKNFKAYDTVLNYEVHSRLATVISLFSMARNRIGYHRHNFNPFTNLNTHSFHFDLRHSIPRSYEEAAIALCAKIPPSSELHRDFTSHLTNSNPEIKVEKDLTYKIGIGAICSDLAPERMMSNENWKAFAKKRLSELEGPVRIYLLGAPNDKVVYDRMIDEVFEDLDVEVVNAAGFMPLGQTIAYMYQNLNEYWGIDTSLLHISRLLGIKSYLFWGPTDPEVYLKEFDFLDSQIYFKKIACSPCVHITRYPPCLGNNVCMNFDFL
ncbi:MAG: hypothetical protein CME65_04555 [Halobacteriovoraceae bacterium]|nr:hypothetical protein [Halobacteriovoraceae bacterium]|tara:strand:- start:9838 stop:10971 length:1134 start_codon:yes stop_codon:yes gene_type:complete